jgi:hypothetical protein
MLASGLVIGSAVGIGGGGRPVSIRTSRWRRVRWGQRITAGLPTGYSFSRNFGQAAGLTFGLASGLIIGLAGGFAFGLASRDTPEAARPTDLRRGDVIVVLAFVVVFPLAIGLAGGLSLGMLDGLDVGLVSGLAAWLIVMPIALVFPFVMITNAWLATISQIYLRIKHHLPLRLGHFLEDVHTRHLLRTVGPIYQFRHATLQDRLAP